MKVNNDVKKAQLQNLANQTAATQNKKSQRSEAANAQGAETKLKTDIFKVEKGSIADAASVDLSSRAQDMKKAKDVAQNASDVRQDKVKQLQALIDNGTYKVDARKIADKMVNEELMTSAALGED